MQINELYIFGPKHYLHIINRNGDITNFMYGCIALILIAVILLTSYAEMFLKVLLGV